MPIALHAQAGPALVRMSGASDRWDLWKSEDLIGVDDSWLGVVKQRPDGAFIGRPGGSSTMLGPFLTLEEASLVIGDAAQDLASHN